jgi:ribosomal protein S18 acetylase RimI-like enzyme
VDVRSLGYRTDLMLRKLEGSEVVDRGDHLVIRSPANPTFWWGNFLLLAAAPGPGQSGRWLSRFHQEFPEADHVALGIDVTDDRAVNPAELLAAGLRLDRNTVMTATQVHEPPRPDRGATYRELSSDDDWRQAAELTAACYEQEPGSDRAFIEARICAERGLTQAGHGFWLGAFRDGQLRAQLGLIADDGIARYQNVETHPDARRRGLAGTLVWQAALRGRDTLGAGTLVMVADPDDEAIRVYRSVGFIDAETEVGFEQAAASRPAP